MGRTFAGRLSGWVSFHDAGPPSTEALCSVFEEDWWTGDGGKYDAVRVNTAIGFKLQPRCHRGKNFEVGLARDLHVDPDGLSSLPAADLAICYPARRDGRGRQVWLMWQPGQTNGAENADQERCYAHTRARRWCRYFWSRDGRADDPEPLRLHDLEFVLETDDTISRTSAIVGLQ